MSKPEQVVYLKSLEKLSKVEDKAADDKLTKLYQKYQK